MIVAKVGGSLFDHPALGPGLRDWLAGWRCPVLLVPGGGKLVDAVRDLDRVHHLGEDPAHWLALQAMTVSAHFLAELIPGAVIVPRPPATFRVGVLDAAPFGRADQGFSGSLPHSWAVTSDAIAARAAVVFRADRLILLKSVSIPLGTDWDAAAAHGWVDDYFARTVAAGGLDVDTLNFRQRLDDCTKTAM